MYNFLKKISKNIFQSLSGVVTKKTFLLFCLLFLIIPLFSEALIGTGIFDFFTASLEGISELTGPFKGFFVALFYFLFISMAALYLGVHLLDIASDPTNLQIMESEFVQIGWQFTSSLANTAIIIALVVIGIATILNREDYHAKKTLPKLIIVALLVNFSLVLVGIVVDISHIILNTFYRVDLGAELTSSIFTVAQDQITQFTAFFTVTIVALAVPFTAPLKQVAFTILMFGVFLPQIITAILTIFTSIVLGSIIYLYTLLFYARTFIIQILAILSPLAFVAWVLPSTESLFKKWWNALVGWSFLGVALFFFLLLSTIAVAPFRPDTPPDIFEYGSIGTIFVYYLTLSVFLGIAGLLSKRMMPAGAKAIIDGVKSTATGFKKVAAPQAKAMRKDFSDKMALGSTQENIEELQRQYDSAGMLGKLRYGAELNAAKGGRFVSRDIAGKSPEAIASQSDIAKKSKSLTKDATNEELERMSKNERKTPYERREAEKELYKRAGTGKYKMSDEEKERAKDRFGNLDEGTQKMMLKEMSNKELKSSVSDFSGTSAQLKAIETLMRRFVKGDVSLDSTTRKAIAENQSRLDGDVLRSAINVDPTLNIDLAENETEGRSKMVRDIENRSASQLSKINLSQAKSEEDKATIARLMIQNPAGMESISEKSSTHQKRALLEGVDNLKNISKDPRSYNETFKDVEGVGEINEETYKKTVEALRGVVVKNKENWHEGIVKVIEKEADNLSESENDSRSDHAGTGQPGMGTI